MDRIPLLRDDREEIIPSEVSQCLNPDCLQINLGDVDLCHNCQEKILLANRYRGLSYIGAGGFAYTFKAIDEHRFQTPCVIKQFVPRQLSEATKEHAIDLFQQEAAILKNLGDNPQIPDLLAFLTQKERLYLVQEFIPGQNLLEILNQQGSFSQEKVKQILINILPVLEFIHQRQVIHRDIKPSNIIRQEDDTLVLIDFGSSLQFSQEFLTQISAISGTPGYVAPEQIKGKAIPASDLFSLGATALHLLTGIIPPHEGIDLASASLDLIWQQAEITPHPEFSKIIAKLLQPEACYRYQSALKVKQDLENLPFIPETGTVKTLIGYEGEETSHPKSEGSTMLRDPQIEPLPSLSVKNSVSIQTISSKTLILNGAIEDEPTFDCEKLKQLLANQDYLAADRETWKLLLQVSDRTVQGCLTLTDIIKFPASKLQLIDSLWQEYSDGNFGFSIQREIYQNITKNTSGDYFAWQKFAEKVGWYQQSTWLKYSELTFNLQVNKGHLPACCIDIFSRHNLDRGGCTWWRLGFIALLDKLEQDKNYKLI